MTVSELIAKLKEQPPDMRVVSYCSLSEDGWFADGVRRCTPDDDLYYKADSPFYEEGLTEYLAIL